MALFDTYSRTSKEMDRMLKEKALKKSQNKKTSKSNNLLARINAIRAVIG